MVTTIRQFAVMPEPSVSDPTHTYPLAEKKSNGDVVYYENFDELDRMVTAVKAQRNYDEGYNAGFHAVLQALGITPEEFVVEAHEFAGVIADYKAALASLEQQSKVADEYLDAIAAVEHSNSNRVVPTEIDEEEEIEIDCSCCCCQGTCGMDEEED